MDSRDGDALPPPRAGAVAPFQLGSRLLVQVTSKTRLLPRSLPPQTPTATSRPPCASLHVRHTSHLLPWVCPAAAQSHAPLRPPRGGTSLCHHVAGHAATSARVTGPIPTPIWGSLCCGRQLSQPSVRAGLGSGLQFHFKVHKCHRTYQSSLPL